MLINPTPALKYAHLEYPITFFAFLIHKTYNGGLTIIFIVHILIFIVHIIPCTYSFFKPNALLHVDANVMLQRRGVPGWLAFVLRGRVRGKTTSSFGGNASVNNSSLPRSRARRLWRSANSRGHSGKLPNWPARQRVRGGRGHE